MADHGTGYYFGQDSEQFGLNYTAWDRAPVSWGVGYKYSISCGDSGETGVTNLSVLIDHYIDSQVTINFTITFSSTTISHLLQHTVGSFWSSGPLTPGPLPGGVPTGTDLKLFKKPRPTASYLPKKRAQNPLPAFDELEAIIAGMHLRKEEHFRRFSQYVAAIKEYADNNQITEAINLRFPNKTWPRFPYEAVYSALLRKYDEEDARRLANYLRDWSEQQMLDEEANWRAVEIWADGLAPKYDYG